MQLVPQVLVSTQAGICWYCINRIDIGYQEYLRYLGIIPLAKQKPLEEKKKVEALKSEDEQKQ